MQNCRMCSNVFYYFILLGFVCSLHVLHERANNILYIITCLSTYVLFKTSHKLRKHTAIYNTNCIYTHTTHTDCTGQRTKPGNCNATKNNQNHIAMPSYLLCLINYVSKTFGPHHSKPTLWFDFGDASTFSALRTRGKDDERKKD